MPDVPPMVPPTPDTDEEACAAARRCVQRVAPEHAPELLAALGLVESSDTAKDS